MAYAIAFFICNAEFIISHYFLYLTYSATVHCAPRCGFIEQ